MVQSLRRVLAPAGLARPGHLLPGRGRRRRRRPLAAPRADPARARAGGDRGGRAEGYEPNVYVDDELYVARVTPEAEALRELPAPRDPSGRRPARVARREPPTKLVCVGDPAALDELEAAAEARTSASASTSRSRCPTSSSSRQPGVTKGSGLDFLAGAPRLHARARRSRSATARTTSSCWSGPATASRSRTRTSG